MVFVPEELTPLYLLEFWETYPELKAWHKQVQQAFYEGRYEMALTLLDPALSYALSACDHSKAAILLLCKADLLRRLQCWGDALAHTQRALQEMRAAFSKIALYNRAVAYYWEGLLHYIIRADDRALQAFAEARKRLDDSERDLRQEKEWAHRVTGCKDLKEWIEQLLAKQPGSHLGEVAWLLPEYRLKKSTLRRITLYSLEPYYIQLPVALLAPYLPVGCSSVTSEDLVLPHLYPHFLYIALRITEDGELLAHSREEDVLVLHVLTPAPSSAKLILSAQEPFVRHSNGEISFRPQQSGRREFRVMPKILIRKPEEGNDA
jgi:tetratricopeptide (TPR) repeat protein